jgi:hypothetical protein
VWLLVSIFHGWKAIAVKKLPVRRYPEPVYVVLAWRLKENARAAVVQIEESNKPFNSAEQQTIRFFIKYDIVNKIFIISFRKLVRRLRRKGRSRKKRRRRCLFRRQDLTPSPRASLEFTL